MKRLPCISSTENERFKLARALTKGHWRKKYGLFLIETPLLVLEALNSDWHVEWMALTTQFAQTEKGARLIELAKRQSVDVMLMHEGLMREISTLESGACVIAVVRQRHQHLGEITIEGRSCVIVLEDVQDPTNVGSIIRIADAVGACGVITTPGTADRYNLKVIRASSGSTFHITIVKVGDVSELERWLMENGFQVVATDPHSGECCYRHRFGERVALLFGNEARGLSERMRRIANVTLTIPMHGRAESLNVSHACAILAYEVLRQWHYADMMASSRRASQQVN
ncbi:MAG: RNA methyltransferase [Armatimonadota bacterium]|nr:RNA methyltransferase [Armatimonadota bacterium]MCX7776546.1 RNA methyltransferase [Armatimonadota bacterium]MDW8024345.1 RNA methyltransferase [Armatimonadota bacterium]